LSGARVFPRAPCLKSHEDKMTTTKRTFTRVPRIGLGAAKTLSKEPSGVFLDEILWGRQGGLDLD
jgi:hypothetical protein